MYSQRTMLVDDKIRTFVGIDLDDNVKQAICDELARLRHNPDFAGVNWQPMAKLHITLCFLGLTAVKNIASLSQAFAKKLVKFQPFSLQFQQVALFPSEKHPHHLIATVNQHSTLARLHQVIADVACDHGFALDKRTFMPHLTLGKIAGKPPVLNTKKIVIEQKVNQLTFFHSDPKHCPDHYPILANFEL